MRHNLQTEKRGITTDNGRAETVKRCFENRPGERRLEISMRSMIRFKHMPMQIRIQNITERICQGERQNNRACRCTVQIRDFEKGFDEICECRRNLEKPFQKECKNDNCRGRNHIGDERPTRLPFGVICADEKQNERLPNDGNGEQSEHSGCQTGICPRELSGTENRSDDLRAQDDEKNRHRHGPENDVLDRSGHIFDVTLHIAGFIKFCER